jgi:hypothetical protein
MKADLLDRIRIAAPCHVSWESMSGTDRARFCSQCQLHVYDISQLSRPKAIALITGNQGRICGRIYRRRDGTILTRDCPVGLRALRRRAARVAGASLAAVLSLFSIAAGQKRAPDKNSCQQSAAYKIERKRVNGPGVIRGKILDANGADVPDARVTLTNELTKDKFQTESSIQGEFILPAVSSGQYTLEIFALGFALRRVEKLDVAGEEVIVTATVEAQALTGVINVISEPPLMSPQGTMILSGDLIRRLPH